MNSDFHYDFHTFTSLKMSVKNGDDFKKEFSKGLYYLNSDYLNPISIFAKLQSLEISFEDSLDLYGYEDSHSVFNVAKRKRNVKRKDFKKSEPLNLYNYAVSSQGEQKFLSYYRILEFFMEQALIERANVIRYNSAITNAELIQELNSRNEQEQLVILLKTVLSNYQKGKISGFCLKHGLIKKREFKLVAIEIYKYRNSIVHAKEKESLVTNFPTPFNENSKSVDWIKVVERLAKECIMKLNKK